MAKDLQLNFLLKGSLDIRRYHSKRSDEVAAIFSTISDREVPDAYFVMCNENTKQLKRVSIIDPNVEPLAYPLFYPTGFRGWHRNLIYNIKVSRKTNMLALS